MIDPTKCQVCYPIVDRIVEMKFAGEKDKQKVFFTCYKQCDKDAVEHVEDYVDPMKSETKFVLHRCAEHKKV